MSRWQWVEPTPTGSDGMDAFFLTNRMVEHDILMILNLLFSFRIGSNRDTCVTNPYERMQ